MIEPTKASDPKQPKPRKPIYLTVKEDLIRRVLSGEWRPGDLVPSEIALAEEYSVSVGTARKAVEKLVQDNVVVRQRGRGTTIATYRGGKAAKPYKFLNFYSEQDERTERATYLDFAEGTATEFDAQQLGIAIGSPVSRVTRLRSASGRPAIIEHIVVRGDFCPNAAERFARLRPSSIASFFDRQYNLLIVRVDEKVYAALADQEDREHLGSAEGEPVLEVIRSAYDLGGFVIEYRLIHARQGVYYTNTTR
ncbi:GntR family transcriptional regulator [Sodalis ligni]|uniref:GntR family transcriptional regulator n=1 Tax=Sodalis ligni TaxID=2697027 RepID=A0A4V2Q2M8_9GAMM|nr:GntR family transcriptional regulator [Sodalis ligni]TCL03498.1 GntR family transcriptional regulator [Sodalis ligni]